MPLTDSDFNNFALALAHRVAKRSKGLDENGRRIIAARPADQILTGFLTPVRDRGTSSPASLEPRTDFTLDGGEDIEASLGADLPRDSAYEQTSLGLEWIVELDQMTGEATIEIELLVSIYVRRFPTFEEQNERKIWERPAVAKSAEASPEAAQSTEPRQCRLIQVWTRADLDPIRQQINMGQLKRERRVVKENSKQVIANWSQIEKALLYTGRRVLTVTEVDLASAEVYDARLREMQLDAMPIKWKPQLDARLIATPTESGRARIALRVINQTEEVKDRFLDFVDPNLYGVQLKIAVPTSAHRMSMFRELPDSFRYNREMFGIGINTHVEGRLEADRTVLETDSVPTKRVDRLEPREIPEASPRFEDLGKDPAPVLKGLLKEMRRYDTFEWASKISSLSGVERDEAISARERFIDEVARFERGIKLLEDERYVKARRAFCLMNRSMQRSPRGTYHEWRLFQIVFIVSQLPSLAAREFPEISQPDDNDVDVLWFAAGGGKTEAFLGLIIWQAFFDRLRGKQIGVTAYVRFPLRLLAFQQVQRLALALAAAETIREEESLGGARFSIGDFVGRSVTPNRIDDDDHRRFKLKGIDKRFQRLFACPFCDSEVALEYEEDLRLIKHVCSNQRCREGSDLLPIYIVDSDIYRYLPTVIVSTVDKIALLGYNKRFANLFGRIDLVCHRHGASFRDINKRECEAAKAFGEGVRQELCDGHLVEFGPFHDAAPALLVQDELHLLSEDVGAFDAHYETAVMELARSLGAQPWKIIAATATIEEYKEQAFQLYLKNARQFPGPGPEAYDSFYYQQNPGKIGRIFLGMLGIGRKHTPAVTRALSNVYVELQRARELAAVSLTDAASQYGTSILSAEEFQNLIFYYELPLTYVLTRKGSDQIAEAIESRVKSDLRELAPNHGELIVDMFNGGVDFTDMAAALQRISSAKPESNPEERIRGLVTTNIIGHGVDVDRFNIIVFAGFTRLVAEYIQASGRVGRTFPGISIFVATPQSERDRSIFDRFGKFHEYLDRLIDPSAVNRWPDPALERTVPGVLAGYLMGVAANSMKVPFSTVEEVQNYQGRGEALSEAKIIEWAESAYGAHLAPSPDRYKERLANRVTNTYRRITNTTPNHGGRPRQLGHYLDAMQSLRDIDDPAYIRVTGLKDKSALLKLLRG